MILLVNQGNSILTVALALHKSVASATLSRQRVAPILITLKPNEPRDICDAYGLTPDEALAAVLDSPEVQHFTRACGPLLVIDQRPKQAPKPTVVPEAPVVAGTVYVNDDAPPPPIRREVAEVKPSKVAERVISRSDIAQDLAQQASGSDNEANDSGPPVLTDNMPSARWTRERLAAYAEERGLTIPPEMSRNAILKKIRTL